MRYFKFLLALLVGRIVLGLLFVLAVTVLGLMAGLPWQLAGVLGLAAGGFVYHANNGRRSG